MLKNYFITAFRSLRKQKFYTGLNILGLSLGLAGGLVLFQFIKYHLSFDRYHSKDGQIYRIVTALHLPDGTVEYSQGAPVPLTAALQNELPQIKDQAVLLKARSLTVGVHMAGQWKYFAEKDNIAFADQHWFNLFDHTWVEGNAATSLREPNTAVITQRLANKYFGKEEPLGKTIRLDNKYDVIITGVLKDYPSNTDIKRDMFLSRTSFRSFYPDADRDMNTSWGVINSTTNSFIWLPGAVPEKRLEDAMASLTRTHFSADVASVYHFHLQALKDIHFDGRYGGAMQRSLLFVLALAGSFLVIIACFNFINLATAQNAKKAKEIGTRKVLGSSTANIFWQFMIETACIALLATALSFAWIQLTLSVLNGWLQIDLQFNFLQDKGLLLCIILMLGAVTLGGGFYPALILSRWKPVDALKQHVIGARSGMFRKGLIVIQNVIVQVLIICALVVGLQVRHIKTANPGFNKNEVLMVPIPDPGGDKLSYLEHQWLANPKIRSVSFCFRAPLSDYNLAGSVAYNDMPWENFPACAILGDAHYLNTFQLELTAGRNLQESDTIREFLVNEAFVHKLAIKDPQQVIGRRLVAGALEDHPGTIVGVVRDFNAHPLYKSMQPALITTNRNRYQYAAIKLSGAGEARDRQAIEQAWHAVYPQNVFEYHYLNEQIDEYYHKEDLLKKLINATTAIAIIIGCLGLLGLTSFFAIQRTREIGIRKVLGASVAGIVYLLTKDFLKLVLLSVIVATPVAWWLMSQWLRDFAYRIQLSWWVFGLAGLATGLIALVTVSYQAVKAAFANPADSLHAE
jgi:putative ABC transport system permease protein